MSYKITTWAWQQDELPSTAKFVLLALADYANEDGKCWPSIPQIAVKMGLARTSTKTIATAIKTLEARGVVTKRGRVRKGTNAQTSHEFTIHWKGSGSTTLGVGVDNPGGGGSQPYESVTEPVTESITSPTPSPLRAEGEKIPSAIDVPSTVTDSPSGIDLQEKAQTQQLRALARDIYTSTEPDQFEDATEAFIETFENVHGNGGVWDAGHMLINCRYDDRLTELIHEARKTRGKERGTDYGIAQWLGIFTNDYKAH